MTNLECEKILNEVLKIKVHFLNFIIDEIHIYNEDIKITHVSIMNLCIEDSQLEIIFQVYFGFSKIGTILISFDKIAIFLRQEKLKNILEI